MLKRNNKKGFTLAELLIVVAIIAVLVAIAVPLFVTALNKAQDATKNANIRAVRGAAAVEILSYTPATAASASSSDEKIYNAQLIKGTEDQYEWVLKGPWEAVGKIDANGNVTSIEVHLAPAKVLKDDGKLDPAKAIETCVAGTNGGYTVTVYLSITELKAA